MSESLRQGEVISTGLGVVLEGVGMAFAGQNVVNECQKHIAATEKQSLVQFPGLFALLLLRDPIGRHYSLWKMAP